MQSSPSAPGYVTYGQQKYMSGGSTNNFKNLQWTPTMSDSNKSYLQQKAAEDMKRSQNSTWKPPPPPAWMQNRNGTTNQFKKLHMMKVASNRSSQRVNDPYNGQGANPPKTKSKPTFQVLRAGKYEDTNNVPEAGRAPITTDRQFPLHGMVVPGYLQPLTQEPEVKQPDQSSNALSTYLPLALIVLVVGYLYYNQQ